MSNDSNFHHCDVLIIGASLAGSCLARQLRLQFPDLDIVVVERKTSFDYWIGESTIEQFWDYCVRQLKLGRYLETHHLPKHGLRFFFDSPEKNVPLAEMSELGRRWYLPIPAYQIDRARFDEDLVAMNRADGIDVRRGETVKSIRIDREDGHEVDTTGGAFRCRWLVDAAGFGSPLGKQLGHVRRDEREHPIGSYWARYEGCPDFDELGDEDWRARVQYSSRFLSTNHFMYEGYWIWVIPVSEGVTSIGVCYHRDKAPLTLKNGDELTAFLKQHRALEQVVGDGRCLDFVGMKQPQRQADPLFSDDRWFMTGMSAGFLDAMFSNSCAHIANTNRFIGELIRLDREGDRARLASRIKHYNLYAGIWHEIVLNSVRGMYSGRYEVQIGLYMASLYTYFGTGLPESMSQFAELDQLSDDHGGGCDCCVEKLKALERKHSAVPRLLRHTADFLAVAEIKDPQRSLNRGNFFDSNPPPHILANPLAGGLNRPKGENGRVQRFAFESGYRYYLRRLAALDDLTPDEAALEAIVELAWEEDTPLLQAYAQLCQSMVATTDLDALPVST